MKSMARILNSKKLTEFIETGEGKGLTPLASLRVYFDKWPYQGFLTASLPDLRESLENENAEEVAELIERADGFIAGIYLFQNEWDMERTSTPEYFQLPEIKWDHNPHGDPEWMYMLNRHGFLVDVAMAYQLTLDLKYLNYIEAFLTKWLKDNPLTEISQHSSWRTIDAGLRVINWVKVLEILMPQPALSDYLVYELIVSIDEHLAFLSSSLSTSRGQSNWAIIEITGIMVGALAFPELDKSDAYVAQALGHLAPALALQIEEDGMQREQSFMYHHEVLICLLQILLIAERNGLKLEPEILVKTKKMTQASAYFIKPDGTQVNYGDSDCENMINLLSVAEHVLKKPFLMSEMVPTVSSLYQKIFVGLNTSQVFLERLTKLPSVAFENAGLYIMRSSDNCDYTMFKCGPLGGGHGHDDQLHLELYTQGRSVLVDSGRYSYEPEHHQRLDYKSGYAHNTIIVDGQNFNEHHDSWGTTKVATPLNQKAVFKEQVQFVEGGHLGYFDLEDPVLVNRKVVYLSEGIWLVSDEISCQKAHQITTNFHFATSSVKQLSKQKVMYQDEKGVFTIEVLNQAKGSVFEINEYNLSLQYNQRQLSQKACFKYQVVGNNSLTYIMSNQEQLNYRKVPVYIEKTILLSDREVECYCFQLPDGLVKYVLIQHREPAQGRRAYYVEGRYIYGRLCVFEDRPEADELNQLNLY